MICYIARDHYNSHLLCPTGLNAIVCNSHATTETSGKFQPHFSGLLKRKHGSWDTPGLEGQRRYKWVVSMVQKWGKSGQKNSAAPPGLAVVIRKWVHTCMHTYKDSCTKT